MTEYLISNVSFVPLNVVTQDVFLGHPYGLAIIDGCLWVANNQTGYLTHYSLTGQKLLPQGVSPFISTALPVLKTWVNLIYDNIIHLSLDQDNVLIGLGLSTESFLTFRHLINQLHEDQLSFVSHATFRLIEKVYQDYLTWAPPLQTVRDMQTVVSTMKYSQDKDLIAPMALIGNVGHDFVLTWVDLATGQQQQSPSYLIAVTTTGLIYGYTPLANVTDDVTMGHGLIAIDNRQQRAMFTGVAMANHTLYVTDLTARQVRVFDGQWTEITENFPFIDQDLTQPLSAHFVPYNLVNIGQFLYVIYGHINTQGDSIVAGAGMGYVSLFDLQGQFIRRFISQGYLNAPWALTIAPIHFGPLSGLLLIGNQGDGLIHGYDYDGQFRGTLMTQYQTKKQINGLNGLISNGTHLYVSSSFPNQYGLIDSLIGREGTQ